MNIVVDSETEKKDLHQNTTAVGGTFSDAALNVNTRVRFATGNVDFVADKFYPPPPPPPPLRADVDDRR